MGRWRRHGGHEVGGPAAEEALQGLHRAPGDAAQGAAPAGVGEADGAPGRVGQGHERAVGRKGREHEAGRVGDQRIGVGQGGGEVARAPAAMDLGGPGHGVAEHLGAGDHRVEVHAQGGADAAAVFEHGAGVVAHVEAQVEALEWPAAHAAGPCGDGMDQAVEAGEGFEVVQHRRFPLSTVSGGGCKARRRSPAWISAQTLASWPPLIKRRLPTGRTRWEFRLQAVCCPGASRASR